MVTPALIAASGGSMVDLDATVFIQFAIFIIVFFIFRQFLFKPVLALIEARRQATESARAQAEKMESEARKLHEDAEKSIREIRSSASLERDKIVEQARRRERELISSARDDAHSVMKQAREEMTKQASSARQALAKDVGALADSVAAKILGRQL